MDKKVALRMMRKTFSKNGWAVLLYTLLMNVSVILVCFADALLKTYHLFQKSDLVSAMWEVFTVFQESLLTNGLGYLLAMVFGALLMYLWKKREFCLIEIWRTEKAMNLRDFLCLLCVFVGCQGFFQVIAIVLEMILNALGLTAMDSLESATGLQSSFSMFLYVAVFAPIGEEILFRGLILRNFLPFGKKFAIFASAFLFGVFHGNIIQSPYAFLVGLVLGYTAVEYSIRWAIILHMVNNLVLSQLMSMLALVFPETLVYTLQILLIWGCAIAAIIVLIVRRKEVAAFRNSGKIHPWPLRAFFTASGVIVLTLFMVMSAISLLTPLTM